MTKLIFVYISLCIERRGQREGERGRQRDGRGEERGGGGGERERNKRDRVSYKRAAGREFRFCNTNTVLTPFLRQVSVSIQRTHPSHPPMMPKTRQAKEGEGGVLRYTYSSTYIHTKIYETLQFASLFSEHQFVH